MNTESVPLKKIHHGKNVKRLREMLCIKQETLAEGLEMTQQNISRIESKEILEEDILEKIATIMKVPVSAIKNFSDEATYNFVANTYNAHDSAIIFNFNPVEKIIELYERIVKEKEETITLLLQLLKEKNNF